MKGRTQHRSIDGAYWLGQQPVSQSANDCRVDDGVIVIVAVSTSLGTSGRAKWGGPGYLGKWKGPDVAEGTMRGPERHTSHQGQYRTSEEGAISGEDGRGKRDRVCSEEVASIHPPFLLAVRLSLRTSLAHHLPRHPSARLEKDGCTPSTCCPILQSAIYNRSRFSPATMKILDSPLAAALHPAASPEFSPLALAEDFTPLPAYKAAQTSNFDISGLLATPLKLHEDLTSGCGGQTWPAGMVLAKHMLRYHREEMGNARM